MAGRRILLIGFAAGLALTAPAGAQESKVQSLQRDAELDKARAEALKEEAARLQAEILAMQADMIATARETQDLEDELTAIEVTLAALRAEESRKLKRLARQHGNLQMTLGALQRIAVQPREALLLSPGTPIDVVRSGMLLRVAVPAIEGRVEGLRDELDDLARLRGKITAEQDQLKRAATALADQRKKLASLIDRKRDLYESATLEQRAAQQRAARLAKEAKSLKDLLDRLAEAARQMAAQQARERSQQAALDEAERVALERAKRAAEQRRLVEMIQLVEEQERRRAEAARSSVEVTVPLAADPESDAATETAAGGTQQASLTTGAPALRLDRPSNVRNFPDSPTIAALIMPARGDVVAEYGARNGNDDEASKGITISARASAQVVAPFDGRVAYAGPFRGYGQILIIEHGGRYHTLLAGLERIDAIVGQWLLAGEPVGVMGGVAGSRPELYLELRRTGRPINPLPWLALTSDKVQG